VIKFLAVTLIFADCLTAALSAPSPSTELRAIMQMAAGLPGSYQYFWAD
jgi:hypothetical protein